MLALSSPSEAWRGHYKGYGYTYRGYGHKHRHGYKGGHKHHSRYGHRGHKHHIRHSPYRHGRKHHVRHRHRHRGIGIYAGYGLHGYYRYRPYGYYRYRPYGYYRYPYRKGYYHKSYKASRYYGHAYADGYGGSSKYTTIDQGNDLDSYGWNLLRENRPTEALQAFGQLAQANPSKGTPKVGYALASAELGRLDKGIWAMRRALRIDPKALHYVNLDEELRLMVEKLAERYEQSRQFSERDSGRSFMLAAMYYLLGDLDAGQEAIQYSYNTSTSAENLKRLIQEETQTQ